MTDDMFFPGVVLVLALGLSTMGLVHLLGDFRHFNSIAEQCEKQGFIQNKTMRIQCRVEKP